MKVSYKILPILLTLFTKILHSVLLDDLYLYDKKDLIELKLNYSSKARGNKLKHVSWYESEDCYVKSTSSECQNESTKCFGVQIDFPYRSLIDSNSLLDNYRYLEHFQSYPDCWPTLRQLICELLFSPCQRQDINNNNVVVVVNPDNNNNNSNTIDDDHDHDHDHNYQKKYRRSYSKVRLASGNLCLKIATKCNFLLNEFKNLLPPQFEFCSNGSIYDQSCKVPRYHHLAWYGTPNDNQRKCLFPLVFTKISSSWTNFMPFCALNCSSHLLTIEEHRTYQKTSLFSNAFSMCFIIFTLITLKLNNVVGHKKVVKKSNHLHDINDDDNEEEEEEEDNDDSNDDVVILTEKMNHPLIAYLCLNLIINFCLLIRFIPFKIFKKGVICHYDDSLVKSESSSSMNTYCIVQFLIIYYCLLTTGVWLFFYSFHLLLFNCFTKRSLKILFKKHKTTWLYLLCGLPLMLVVYPLSTGSVEADGISGVCFLGYSRPILTITLILIPLSLLFLLSLILSIGSIVVRKKIDITYCTSSNCGQSIKNDHYFQLDSYISNRMLIAFYFVHGLTFVTFWALKFGQKIGTVQTEENLSHYVACNAQKSIALTYNHTVFMASSNHQPSSIFNESSSTCRLNDKPSLILLQIEMCLLFICSIVTCLTLTFSGSNLKPWLRLIDHLSRLYRRLNSTFCYKLIMGDNQQQIPIVNAQNQLSVPLMPILTSSNSQSVPDLRSSNHNSTPTIIGRQRESYSAFVQRFSRSATGRRRSTPSSLRSTSLSSYFDHVSASRMSTTFPDQQRPLIDQQLLPLNWHQAFMAFLQQQQQQTNNSPFLTQENLQPVGAMPMPVNGQWPVIPLPAPWPPHPQFLPQIPYFCYYPQPPQPQQIPQEHISNNDEHRSFNNHIPLDHEPSLNHQLSVETVHEPNDHDDCVQSTSNAHKVREWFDSEEGSSCDSLEAALIEKQFPSKSFTDDQSSLDDHHSAC